MEVAEPPCDFRERERLASRLEERVERERLLLWSGSSRSDRCVFMFMLVLVGYLLDLLDSMSMVTVAGEGDW